jgi:TRAP-type C4-dicarboxylate transport system permease small subunit
MIAFLEKFERFNRRISFWVEGVGVLALFLMVGITCLDVAGSKIFNTPVFGSIDIVMAAQLLAIPFGAAMTLILNKHVEVEFFVVLLPRRLRILVDCIVHFFGFALFLAVVWRLFVYGYSLQSGGEVSATAGLPLFVFAYGAAVALIAVCLVYLQRLSRLVLKVIKNES